MKNTSHFKTALLKATLFMAIFFICLHSHAQITQNQNKVIIEQNNKKVDTTDRERDVTFLVDAANINLEEILLGQLAQKKSTMPCIQALGKMMEEDHRKSQNDLSALAKKKLIVIPTVPGDNAQDAYKKLSNESEIEFDKAYCDMMVNGHKAAIAEFEKASIKCSDSDIKGFAKATLPDLHRHLSHAIDCQKQVEK